MHEAEEKVKSSLVGCEKEKVRGEAAWEVEGGAKGCTEKEGRRKRI